MTVAAFLKANLPRAYLFLGNGIGRAALIGANDGPNTSLLVGRQRLFVLGCIHDIILVFDTQNLLTIESVLYEGLIFFGNPEPIDLLVLRHEVSALDPEGKLPSGVSFDADHRVFVNINP